MSAGVRVTFLFVLLMGLAVSPAKAMAIAQILRFRAPIDRLLPLLESGKTPSVIVEELLKANARGDAFKLQGLAKLYKGYYEEAKHEAAVAKYLEDSLGALTDLADWKKFAEGLEGADSQKKAVLAYLAKEEKRIKASVAAQLKEVPRNEDIPKILVGQTFIGARNVIRKMRESVGEWDWDKYKKDRNYVLEALRMNLKEISDTTYDLNELEGEIGIHEFRRNLRQFLIQSQATRGMILLTDETCPIGAYEALLKDPVAKEPYNTLTPTPEETPCYLSKCLFLGVSQASNELALAKESGQGEEMLKRFFLAQKRSEREAAKKALELAHAHPQFHNYRLRAKEIYSVIRRNEILKMLRKELKACLE